MCFYDLMNSEIQHTQNYSTFAYLPYAFVGLHFQMAATLAQKIKYPTAQTEVCLFFFPFSTQSTSGPEELIEKRRLLLLIFWPLFVV